MQGKYVPLKTIVSMCLDELGKSIRDFDRIWIIAFRALSVLNQSIAAEPKTVRLPVLGNKTVPLPSDYVSWSKIGVVNDLGQVCALRVNNALTTFSDNNPLRLTDIAGDVSNSLAQLANSSLWFNYYNDGAYFNLFGASGGLITFGECRVDERNNVIILSPNFQYPDIVLEYITNPEMDGDYAVPGYLQEAIIAFCAWKLKQNTEPNFYARAIEARRSAPNQRVTLQRVNEVIRAGKGQYLRS
jgi:hypothetical protein